MTLVYIVGFLMCYKAERAYKWYKERQLECVCVYESDVPVCVQLIVII